MFIVERLNIAKMSILPKLSHSRAHFSEFYSTLTFVNISMGISSLRQQFPANQSYPPDCEGLSQATQRTSSPSSWLQSHSFW